MAINQKFYCGLQCKVEGTKIYIKSFSEGNIITAPSKQAAGKQSLRTINQIIAAIPKAFSMLAEDKDFFVEF